MSIDAWRWCKRAMILIVAWLGLVAGGVQADAAQSPVVRGDTATKRVSAESRAASGSSPSGAKTDASGTSGSTLRQAYFGDLHVHTKYSFDAFIFGTRAGPDDAYRFARGEAIQHPAGFEMQLDRPLDFQAVTDHAMFLGMMPALADPESRVGDHPFAEKVRSAQSPETRYQAFQAIRPYIDGSAQRDLLDTGVVRSAWGKTIDAAERHNQPGQFTTFIGYEYTTAGPAQQNLHRNVIFRGADVPPIPFSRLDSVDPEDLWDWLDRQRWQGREALAIPHNSNGSDGKMFERADNAGAPIDADYAAQRLRNEPLVEITQVKGTSETHPMLSPNDEWADFEIFPYRIASDLKSDPPGGYVRDAYRRGLEMAAARDVNPYRFGVIGSSDSHVAAGSYSEADYWSKIGMLDATPQRRGSVPLEAPGPTGNRYADSYYKWWGASGLMGVWAEANTRAALYDAMRRKETFATSGPRMRVRFFAGYGLEQALADAQNPVAAAYANGAPMGGELKAREGATAPGFLVWALRDPQGAPLQRVQVIKGWVDAQGDSDERVYDVACSDGLQVDPDTHRCPDNGAQVQLSDCSISQDVGAGELRTLWRDPDFDPEQSAFYYVRALQNPTCRWSTWDAVRAGVQPRTGLKPTLQERAWSSPIWYRP